MGVILVGLFVFGTPFLLNRMQLIGKSKKLSFALLIAYLSSVIMITIGFRTNGIETMVNLRFFSSYEKMFAPAIEGFKNDGIRGAISRLKWITYASRSSIVLNIFLFVPLGYLLPLVSQRVNKWYYVTLIGVFLSLEIELSQLLTHRGWFDIDDIFHNGLGAFIGWLCYKRWLSSTINANDS